MQYPSVVSRPSATTTNIHHDIVPSHITWEMGEYEFGAGGFSAYDRVKYASDVDLTTNTLVVGARGSQCAVNRFISITGSESLSDILPLAFDL